MTEQELDLFMRNVLLDCHCTGRRNEYRDDPVHAVAASPEANQGNAQEPSALGA